MAKKNKKRKRGGGGGNGGAGRPGGALFLADLAGEVLGNVLGQLAADGVERLGRRGRDREGDDAERRERDVSAKVLRELSEHGPKSIPDLLESSGVGLSDLLHALQSVRDFRLVEFVGEGETVQLTRAGSQTVTVLQKDGMRREAARLLQA